MAASVLTESHVEDAALAWFGELGYTVLHGPDIAPGEPLAERDDYGQVVLAARLRRKLADLNPHIPADALDEAARKVTRPASASLINNNRLFHRMLVDGVEVEYRRADNSIAGDRARLVDFDEPNNNDWLAVNQFTVIEGQHNRRPDIVLFVNGLPLAVIELKNAADERRRRMDGLQAAPDLQAADHAPLQLERNSRRVRRPRRAHGNRQLRPRTLHALAYHRRRRAGTRLHASTRSAAARRLRAATLPRPDTLFHRVRGRRRRSRQEDGGLSPVPRRQPRRRRHRQRLRPRRGSTRRRRLAHARVGQESHDGLLRRPPRAATRRWRTRPSSSSPTATTSTISSSARSRAATNCCVRRPCRPSTARTFGNCCKSRPAAWSSPPSRNSCPRRRATATRSFQTGATSWSSRTRRTAASTASRRSSTGSRADSLRLRPAPARRPAQRLVHRLHRNAHRVDRRATRARSSATTSTSTTSSAPSHDGATVPIYYESRLAKLELDDGEKPHIDEEFEEVTEGEEVERQGEAQDQVGRAGGAGRQPEARRRSSPTTSCATSRTGSRRWTGKAMIVCMSRRICVELYDAIVELRPDWHSDDDDDRAVDQGRDDRQRRRRSRSGSRTSATRPRREALAKRFKDAERPVQARHRARHVADRLRRAVPAHDVRRQADAGHGLMQAIARVNRVFRDKPGGLVVDYLGLADQLKTRPRQLHREAAARATDHRHRTRPSR